jgi:hypothetical protein
MQGKWLAFPFIPFAESGLFNRLWRIQIKKSRPTLRSQLQAEWLKRRATSVAPTGNRQATAD